MNMLNQLRILIAIPMVILVGGFAYIVFSLYEDLEKIQRLREQAVEITHITELIHELQIERGLSNGYIGTHDRIADNRLINQRKEVDLLFAKHHYNDTGLDTAMLFEHRKQVDVLVIGTTESFDFYTRYISSMRDDYLAIVRTVEDYELRNEFQAYTNLMAAKETLGQIRAGLNGAFSQKQMSDDLLIRFLLSKGEHDTAMRRYRTLVNPALRERLENEFAAPDVIQTYQIIDAAIADHARLSMMDPKEWFSLSTRSIERLRKIELETLAHIDHLLNRKIDNAESMLWYVWILFFIVIVAVLGLGLRIAQNLIHTFKLLEEYKDAVDRSSIVTKTDTKGIITYANDRFCAISGYTRDELIGLPHNVVRHPDTPNEVYAQMWQTISNGSAWQGVIKNKNKYGSFYWADTTINPILDHHGKIEEYIAIRSDVTEAILLHEELAQTQQEMIERIGEIGETRSRETGYHVRRVAEYSALLARLAALGADEIKLIAGASPMHDIGKVAIPDTILNKAGPLNEEEKQCMQTHAQVGYEIFKDSERPLLKTAAIIAYEHHEKFDGSGYPRGLAGENIHIYGRITAIADVFDALGSDRCYKKAWPIEQIIALFHDERGKHFDPVLIDLMFEYWEEFLAIKIKYDLLEKRDEKG